MKKINLIILLLLAFAAPISVMAATSLNTTFQTNRGTGPDNFIYNVDMQSDGKVLIVGRVTSYNGVTTGGLVRINTDGSLDTTFNNNLVAGSGGGASGLGGYTYDVDVQSDGKILVVGNFSTYGTTTMHGIARFNSDGTPDTTFINNVGTGANSYVFEVQQLQSGKILAVGSFSTFNGATVSGVVLLNSDGTPDTSFTTNLGTGFSGGLERGFAETANGKIIMMGDFTSLNGTTVGGIVRLNVDGTIDNTFNQGTGFAGGYPWRATPQSNGKLLVVSTASTYNGVAISTLARLNSDGTLDTDFVTNVGSTNYIYRIAVQADGKILVSGSFSTFNGVSVNKIIRLNSDGTTDTDFVTDIGTGFSDGLSKDVGGMVVDSSGNIALGSRTGSFNGVANTHYLIKLVTDIVIPDTTAPVISEITPISTGTDTTPDYTFTTDEAGTITYGGSCSSATTAATLGSNTITFSTLTPGTYSNCTITVTDTALNASNILAVTSFTISAPASESTPTPTQGASAVSFPILSSAEIQRIFGTNKSNNINISNNNPLVPNPVDLETSMVKVTYVFARNLQQNMRGEDVRQLQIFLNTHGFPVSKISIGSRGNETTYFGPATRLALVQFQRANKINPAVGFLGPVTRSLIGSFGGRI